MNVLVTGATGFTGPFVVNRLVEMGLTVRCFVRLSSDISVLPESRIQLAYGDLADSLSLGAALSGVDALVNLASLGFGHAPTIVSAAVQAGVKRAIFISTTAIFTALSAKSKVIRLAAEDAVFESGLNCTILRPTMIFGNGRDRNMCRLVRFLRWTPVVPLPGRRDALQQPVYVDDVASAVCQVLQRENLPGRAYNIGGASALTFEQIVDTVCGMLGWRVVKVRIPAGGLAGVLASMESLGLRLPIRAEQVLRLNEDKRFDYVEAARDFGYSPRTFAEGMTLELRDLGLSPLDPRA
jgi:nucleoside-diphosphate-sugar epimerase